MRRTDFLEQALITAWVFENPQSQGAPDGIAEVTLHGASGLPDEHLHQLYDEVAAAHDVLVSIDIGPGHPDYYTLREKLAGFIRSEIDDTEEINAERLRHLKALRASGSLASRTSIDLKK